MATEHKGADATCNNESRHWPASLLGCLQSTPSTSQLPWLMFKACLCPASVLGANETLFQGEEPADVCCLQPYSFCGPTCRSLNAQLCGLGNEGLKVCAHTCILQAACSCLCLGLPYVAWLTALQRQRVVAKHGVAVTDEDAWATACYPCSLLQMHALLQQHQQHQYQQQGRLSPRRQQQQQFASAALRAPAMQHMTACASEAASQASSYAGPLTSAITSSKVLRTVRDHSTRSDGAAAPGASHAGASSRVGPRDSQDSAGGSSQASETGVVNSPMVERREQQQTEVYGSGHESSRSRGDLSARHSNSRRTSARNSSDGATCSSKQQHPLPGSSAYLRPPPPSAQQQPQQLGPLMSARSHSSNGNAALSTHHQLPPPQPGPARHCRTGSMGRGTGAGADAFGDTGTSAAASRGSDSSMPELSADRETPEPPAAGTARSSQHKRKLPGRAAMASQSCHWPNGFHGNSRSGLHDSIPCTPPQAEAAAATGLSVSTSVPAAAAGEAVQDSSSSSMQPGMSTTPVHAGMFGSSTNTFKVHGSCKVSLGGSCGSRLVTFSQEDVPLSAFKPNPGKANRRASTGASTGVSSSAGGLGWLQQGAISTTASMANSSTQQQGHSEQLLLQKGQGVGSSSSNRGPSSSSSTNGTSTGCSGADHQQHGTHKTGAAAAAAAVPAGLAALVAEGPGISSMQVNPQYATMQSDICNFASWLGEPAQDAADADCSQPQQQQQQQQQQRQEPQRERSEGDMCNFDEPVSPPACSPKPAVSPAAPTAALGARANPSSNGSDSAAAAADDAGGAAAAAAAAACASRPTVLAAAWAYMSDICNLGGSFDAANSVIGRTGLAAAVLSRFAEESSNGGASQQHVGGLDGVADTRSSSRPASASAAAARPSSSRGSIGSREQQTASGAAATSSRPDTATLEASAEPTASAAHESHCVPSTFEQSVGASSVGGVAGNACLPMRALHVGDVPDTAGEDSDEVSSPPRRKRRGAAGGAYPCGSSRSSSMSATSAAAAGDARSAGQTTQSRAESGKATSGDPAAGAAAAAPAAPSAADALDPHLLAAVTGTTSRDELTASQEELAAKLARLAFANPTAARQLAGSQQQQQQQRQQQQQHGSSCDRVAAPGPQGQLQKREQQQQVRRQLEPFYPTMMSDMCNLADPDDGQDLPVRESSRSILDSATYTTAAAAGAAAVGDSMLQQQQGQAQAVRAGSTGSASKPPGLPASAVGPAPYRPNLPGRVVRQPPPQQQQQYATAASRLGRTTISGTAPVGTAAATAAGSDSSGSGNDTAGPLRAALLLRGLRAAPGGVKPVLPGVGSTASSSAAAAAALGRRMACPGDAAGDARMTAAGGGGGGGNSSVTGYGGVASLSSLQGGHGDEGSLASFDSYYVDCDLRHAGELGSCGGGGVGGVDADAEVANMITNNPLYTFASDGGGTADSARFSPGLKQQLRDAAVAAPGNGGRESPSRLQQQWQRGGSSEAAKGAAGAGAGSRAGAGQRREARVLSSDHNDDAQQPDNSRSSSPAPLLAAGDAAVYATAEKGSVGKGADSRGAGSRQGLVSTLPGSTGIAQAGAGMRSNRA